MTDDASAKIAMIFQTSLDHGFPSLALITVI